MLGRVVLGRETKEIEKRGSQKEMQSEEVQKKGIVDEKQTRLD